MGNIILENFLKLNKQYKENENKISKIQEKLIKYKSATLRRNLIFLLFLTSIPLFGYSFFAEDNLYYTVFLKENLTIEDIQKAAMFFIFSSPLFPIAFLSYFKMIQEKLNNFKISLFMDDKILENTGNLLKEYNVYRAVIIGLSIFLIGTSVLLNIGVTAAGFSFFGGIFLVLFTLIFLSTVSEEISKIKNGLKSFSKADFSQKIKNLKQIKKNHSKLKIDKEKHEKEILNNPALMDLTIQEYERRLKIYEDVSDILDLINLMKKKKEKEIEVDKKILEAKDLFNNYYKNEIKENKSISITNE